MRWSTTTAIIPRANVLASPVPRGIVLRVTAPARGSLRGDRHVRQRQPPVRWVPSEVTLLKAAWMLLNKQKDSFYVLNLLTETVFYDGADCDGYCLSDDILDYLLDKGINPQAEG